MRYLEYIQNVSDTEFKETLIVMQDFLDGTSDKFSETKVWETIKKLCIEDLKMWSPVLIDDIIKNEAVRRLIIKT